MHDSILHLDFQRGWTTRTTLGRYIELSLVSVIHSLIRSVVRPFWAPHPPKDEQRRLVNSLAISVTTRPEVAFNGHPPTRGGRVAALGFAVGRRPLRRTSVMGE